MLRIDLELPQLKMQKGKDTKSCGCIDSVCSKIEKMLIKCDFFSLFVSLDFSIE